MTTSGSLQIEIKDHGDRQLELKSHIPLTSRRIGRYKVDAWFFIPASLGINAKDYGVERFLKEMKSLTRFSPSYIPLGRLIDPGFPLSPLIRIRKEMETATMPREFRSKHVLYELRSLANIYSSVSEEAGDFVSTTITEGKLSLIKDSLKKELKDVRAFLEQWHDLYSLFRKPGVPSDVLLAYDWTDESISITTERYLYDLHDVLDADEESKSLLKRIRSLMDQEREYRKTMGYRVLVEDALPEEIEKRIYRESILKKWGQSVLYLAHEESGTRRNMNHVLAGLAAAIAMAFAVGVTIIAERRFPGQSLTWAVAIVIAYIFKDRIKESLRNILTHTLPSLVSDERIRLTDQASGHRIGRVNSRVRFLRARSAPMEIAHLVEDGTGPFRRILPEEDLVYFRREFTIRNRILYKHHARLSNLADIVRLNMEAFFHNMDNPEKSVRVFGDDALKELYGHRIYPINLVLKITEHGSRQDRYLRYRIILDRTGLRRIEEHEH